MGPLPFGCGQCLPCRINKVRTWSHRIMLENLSHGDSTFLTLTYDDPNLPENNSLVYEHHTQFIKNLRSKLGYKIRFFGVGEYGNEGTRKWNPHYHYILFGYPGCHTLLEYKNPKKTCPCPGCQLIHNVWKKGKIHCGSVTLDSAQYVAGYVTKKLTNKKDPYVLEQLEGRHPEFARMSLKPGIGALSVDQIGTAFGLNALKQDDVPGVLQHGQKKLPLGRYLMRKLRKFYGFDEKAPEEIIKKLSDEMHALFETALQDPKNKSKTLKQILKDQNIGKINSLEAKEKIWKNKQL